MPLPTNAMPWNLAFQGQASVAGGWEGVFFFVGTSVSDYWTLLSKTH